MLFGEYLVECGAVTLEQLSEALRLQRQRRTPVTTIAVELGVIRRSQEVQLRRKLDKALVATMRRSLSEFGLSPAQVEQVLDEFRGSADPIGCILVQLGCFTPAELVKHLRGFSSDLVPDEDDEG